MSGPARAQVRQNLQNHNYVSVKIKHLITNALIDTGAYYSCVSLPFIKRLKLQSRIVPLSNQKRLFTADGKPMHVTGTIQLILDIQDCEIPVSFCVLPRLQFNVILGIHFLRQTKANIDLDSQILTLHNDSIGVDLLKNTDTIVITSEAVLIPPKTERLIPLLIPPHFGSGLAIVEPSCKLYKLQLTLAKSIVSPINNRTVCKVMNPTNVA